MLTKAQIELARDWNAAHYHPEHEHARTCDKALAAAQAAVVKAAMDAWRAGAFGTRSLEDMVANAACADLAALEGK